MLQTKVFVIIILIVKLTENVAIQMDDDACKEQLLALTEALSAKEFWALKRMCSE